MPDNGLRNTTTVKLNTLISTFKDEKKQLQNLNERLACCLRKNLTFEADIFDVEYIANELAAVNSVYLENVRDIYGEEMNRLRASLNAISLKYAEACIQIKVAESEKENALIKVSILTSNNNNLNTKIEELLHEIISLKKSLSNLEIVEHDLLIKNSQFEALKEQLEVETIARTELENTVISLMEEMELINKVHRQEYAKWNHDLKAIESIVKNNDAQNSSLLNDVDEYFERLKNTFFSSVRNGTSSQPESSLYNKTVSQFSDRISAQNIEIERLRSSNTQLIVNTSKLEKHKTYFDELNQRVQNLQEELDSERDRYQNEMSRLIDLLDAKSAENRSLACSKIKLNSELAYYRCLLSDENSRLHCFGKSCKELAERSFSGSVDEGFHADLDEEESIESSSSISGHSHSIKLPQFEPSAPEKSLKYQAEEFQSLTNLLLDIETYFPNLGSLLQSSLSVWPGVPKDILPLLSHDGGYFQEHSLVISSLDNCGVTLQPSLYVEDCPVSIHDNIVCNLNLSCSGLGSVNLEGHAIWLGPDYSSAKKNPFTRLLNFPESHVLHPGEEFHLVLICEANRSALPKPSENCVFIKLTRRLESFISNNSHLFFVTDPNKQPTTIWSARPGCSHLKYLADNASTDDESSVDSILVKSRIDSPSRMQRVRFSQPLDAIPIITKSRKRTWNAANASTRHSNQSSQSSVSYLLFRVKSHKASIVLCKYGRMCETFHIYFVATSSILLLHMLEPICFSSVSA
ncbi:hypothetical protein Ciccas_008199 [Cichlidogyrus casuarinus]|uniref:IF rod domain-containing protein n=1 Tax=Cichlidogyrus casuarinus TaxID=1844966 RepID=A0ABD2Q0N5_9PLAT